jgi:hypothetical protein
LLSSTTAAWASGPCWAAAPRPPGTHGWSGQVASARLPKAHAHHHSGNFPPLCQPFRSGHFVHGQRANRRNRLP